MTLDPVRIRVLGALTENEIATPENYPLSLNALVNACNQRSRAIHSNPVGGSAPCELAASLFFCDIHHTST